jgi:hypothetical protein
MWNKEINSQEVCEIQVLTAASIKMAAFQVVMLWSLVEVHRRFIGVAAFIIRVTMALMMEAASTSEMSVNS